MNIVGISGAAGAGKVSAAKGLIETLGYRKLSFAEPLKRALNEMFGWDMGNWEDPEWKETPQPRNFMKSPRELAQTLGTQWGRQMVSPNMWVDAALRQMWQTNAPGVVFTDVRFPNESQAIKLSKGCHIHLTRFDRTGKVMTLTGRTSHESEGYLADLQAEADFNVASYDGQINRLQRDVLVLVMGFFGPDKTEHLS